MGQKVLMGTSTRLIMSSQEFSIHDYHLARIYAQTFLETEVGLTSPLVALKTKPALQLLQTISFLSLLPGIVRISPK